MNVDYIRITFYSADHALADIIEVPTWYFATPDVEAIDLLAYYFDRHPIALVTAASDCTPVEVLL